MLVALLLYALNVTYQHITANVPYHIYCGLFAGLVVPHVKPWPSSFFITLVAAAVSYLGRGIFHTGALNIIWALRRYNQAVAPALTHGKKPDTATAWQVGQHCLIGFGLSSIAHVVGPWLLANAPAAPLRITTVLSLSTLAVLARHRLLFKLQHWLWLVPRVARSIHYHGSALCFRLRSYTAAWAALPFTYHRLAGGPGESIRLLTIAPSRDSGALVRCLMEEVALSAAEADGGSGAGYEAVSHRWSHGRAWVPVEVDGAQLGVTGRVAEVLRRLREPDAPRRVWIDSLCINQSDPAERAAQVPAMARVYAAARRVVACLPYAAASHGALAHLRSLRRLLAHLPPDQLRAALADRFARRKRGCYDPGWIAVGALVRSDWFQRVWIIQEVATARAMVVRHGGEQASWEDVAWVVAVSEACDAASVYLDDSVTGLSMGKYADIERGLTSLQLMDRIRLLVRRETRPPTLDRLLGYSVGFSATVARDRVYAFLGLASLPDGQMITPTYEEKKSDDSSSAYETSDRRVFADAGRIVLTQSLRNFHLAGTGFTGPLPFLPTWVPNWVTPRIHHSPLSGVRFRASPPYLNPCVKAISGDWERLRVRASVLDTVKTLGDVCIFPMGGYLPGVFAAFALQRQLEAGRSLVKETDPTLYAEGFEDAFWRTVFHDSSGPGSQPPVAREKLDLCRAVFLLNFPIRGFTVEPDIMPAVTKHYQNMGRDNAETIANQMVGSALAGKRLMVTSNGFFGVVPPKTERGDKVALIWGASTPTLLRPQSHGTYAVVGSCYVQGMMLGELGVVSQEQYRMIDLL